MLLNLLIVGNALPGRVEMAATIYKLRPGGEENDVNGGQYLFPVFDKMAATINKWRQAVRK